MTNLSFSRPHLAFTVALAALTFAGGAQAQSSMQETTPSYSIFGPGASYLGFNGGQSRFKAGNGLGGFASNKTDRAYSLYAGSYFNNNFGLEAGYTDFGRVSRAGGTTKAQGFNVSLIGRLPLGSAFSALGRLGTTYGRTDVSSSPLSGINSGSASGFGLSYGVGLEYAISSNWSGVLQYDEHQLKFANNNRDTVSNTSLGLKYRF